MADATHSLQAPKLTATNYSGWKYRLLGILEARRVCDVCVKEPVEADFKDETFKTKDALARAFIVQCLTDKHLEYVRNAKNAFEMLASLGKVFERKNVLSRFYARQKLWSLKHDGESPLEDHFVVFDQLIRDLIETGAKLDEEDKVCHLLETISERYEIVITVLQTQTSNDQLTLDFVKAKLLDVELKLRSGLAPKNDDCSFAAKFNDRGRDHNRPRTT